MLIIFLIAKGRFTIFIQIIKSIVIAVISIRIIFRVLLLLILHKLLL